MESGISALLCSLRFACDDKAPAMIRQSRQYLSVKKFFYLTLLLRGKLWKSTSERVKGQVYKLLNRQ